jgi:pimeloyl-ACP methyl ester carboxylesterase
MTAAAAPSPAGRSALTGFDDRSRWIDLGGPVHYLDFGGPANAPTIVCVHGLGGSAVNWSAIAPLLTDRFRLLAPDLAGHGLTRSVGRGTDVTANRALLHRFIQSVPGAPVILMGNSMGGMISLIEAAAAPDAVAGLVLLDPALPFVPTRPDPLVAAMFFAYAMPGLGWALMAARRRALSPETLVATTLSLCCVDASRIPADVVAQHVAMARRRAQFADATRDFLAAARSVSAAAGYFRGSAYRRGIRSITAPVLLLHGDRDRLVPVGVARAAAVANPSWSLTVLRDIGHVPQLEAPQDTARAVFDWLDDDGRHAVDTATPRLPEKT